MTTTEQIAELQAIVNDLAPDWESLRADCPCEDMSEFPCDPCHSRQSILDDGSVWQEHQPDCEGCPNSQGWRPLPISAAMVERGDLVGPLLAEARCKGIRYELFGYQNVRNPVAFRISKMEGDHEWSNTETEAILRAISKAVL